MKNKYFLLCNDLLVSGKLLQKKTGDFRAERVYALQSSSHVVAIDDTLFEGRRAFSFIANNVSLVLIANTEKKKTEWMEVLEKTIVLAADQPSNQCEFPQNSARGSRTQYTFGFSSTLSL